LGYAAIDANLGKCGPFADATITAIPEPSVWVLGGLSVFGLLAIKRRRATAG
jgi:hypothetical protein